MGQFNFNIPDELHDEFRIYSIKVKKDMKDILVELIKERIINNKGTDNGKKQT